MAPAGRGKGAPGLLTLITVLSGCWGAAQNNLQTDMAKSVVVSSFSFVCVSLPCNLLHHQCPGAEPSPRWDTQTGGLARSIETGIHNEKPWVVYECTRTNPMRVHTGSQVKEGPLRPGIKGWQRSKVNKNRVRRIQHFKWLEEHSVLKWHSVIGSMLYTEQY